MSEFYVKRATLEKLSKEQLISFVERLLAGLREIEKSNVECRKILRGEKT